MVKRYSAEAAARSLGMEPKLRLSNGGLDANWLVRHGIPTVTFGAGQTAIHTVDEWVDAAAVSGGVPHGAGGGDTRRVK